MSHSAVVPAPTPIFDDDAGGSNTRPSSSRGASRALIVGNNALQNERAEQWMHHENIDIVHVDNAADVSTHPEGMDINVMVVAADAREHDARPSYRVLADDPRYPNIPLIVLCKSPEEIEAALQAGATDVVREPVDWNIVSRRVATLATLQKTSRELATTREELSRVSQHVEDSRRALSQLGDTDRLTGLPSLAKFRDILTRALCQTDELALFFIGLERFHVINEAHGRETGDRILEAVGARLQECLVRPELHAPGSTGVLAACAAKLDSVRFGLFLPYSGNPSHLQTIRRVLTDVLNEPHHIDGRTVYLTSSIGGAISPRDGDDAAKIMFNAEHAMMKVKRKGGGFAVFAEDSGMSSARMLELDRWLREAVEGNELRVAYQPLVNLWNDRIVGAEALLRWHKEPHGYISPAEFVPVAERSGIMVQIGELVIDRACAELRRWHDRGHTHLRMAINLSLIQLRRGDVKRTIENAIDRYDLAPELIEMEISERGAIGDDQRIIRQLHEIKSSGVRLSLDDFGTGDAAIEYLKRLPIDILKLDRSYVAGALENGADAVIAKALVGLARSMNLTVIAEGVESREQHQLLRDWGCHIFQGFFCSPAVFGDAFLELLHKQSQDHSQDLAP